MQCDALVEAASKNKDLSAIKALLDTTGLLPQGVPSGITILLPNNDAVGKLLAPLGFSDPDLLVAAWPALPKDISGRVVSALLYHIIPTAPLTAAELGAEGDVPTALAGSSLKFNAAGSQARAMVRGAAATRSLRFTQQESRPPARAEQLPAALACRSPPRATRRPPRWCRRPPSATPRCWWWTR